MPTMGLFNPSGSDLNANVADTQVVTYGSGMRAGQGHQVLAGGSPTNGPLNGTFGQTISVFKQGFGTSSAKGGEIDGLYVVLRQDTRDGVQGDGCGLLIDAGFYDNAGFVGGIEGATTKFAKSNGAQVNRLVYQIGCMDHASSTEIGIFARVEIGEATAGMRLQSNHASGAVFTDFIQAHNGAFNAFRVDNQGVVTQASPAGEFSGVRVNNGGTRAWLNNPANAELMTLDQAGNLSVLSSLRVPPRTSAPPVQQGRIWQDAYTGKLKVCEDGVNWRTVVTA